MALDDIKTVDTHCQSEYLEVKLNYSQGSIDDILKYAYFVFVFDLPNINLSNNGWKPQQWKILTNLNNQIRPSTVSVWSIYY